MSGTLNFDGYSTVTDHVSSLPLSCWSCSWFGGFWSSWATAVWQRCVNVISSPAKADPTNGTFGAVSQQKQYSVPLLCFIWHPASTASFLLQAGFRSRLINKERSPSFSSSRCEWNQPISGRPSADILGSFAITYHGFSEIEFLVICHKARLKVRKAIFEQDIS